MTLSENAMLESSHLILNMSMLHTHDLQYFDKKKKWKISFVNIYGYLFRIP